MQRLDAAERAIEAFEQLHGLNVTLHDLTGDLSPYLKPHRFYHRSALCLAVKAAGHYAACDRFENHELRLALPRFPEGRIQVCHAQLLEWVVPVFEQETLCWVIYAGPRTAGRNLTSAHKERPTRWLKSPWKKGLTPPPPIQEEPAQIILEHLRQLAARLRYLIKELKTLPAPGPSTLALAIGEAATRRIAILRFIENHYAEPTTLPDLARRLGLSESRTSHLVRASCGQSFRELLIQKRLHVAMDLLRESDISVLDVALASGFTDIAHFHRLFRRRIGTTPAQYRVNGRT
jgi:AraC-like DNA-binding protein